MTIRKAKILTDDQFENILTLASLGKHPRRDVLMLLLSFKCGLRAAEIANLRRFHVTDAEGRVLTQFFEVGEGVTKGGRDAKIPMHPRVYGAMVDYLIHFPHLDYLMYGEKTPRMTPGNLTVYLFRLYRRVGMEGCSSHSGRRTFITKAARSCNNFGGSIKDVQALARHADIRTTEAYIEPSANLLKFAFSL